MKRTLIAGWVKASASASSAPPSRGITPSHTSGVTPRGVNLPLQKVAAGGRGRFQRRGRLEGGDRLLLPAQPAQGLPQTVLGPSEVWVDSDRAFVLRQSTCLVSGAGQGQPLVHEISGSPGRLPFLDCPFLPPLAGRGPRGRQCLAEP